jgi:hypothetical protein
MPTTKHRIAVNLDDSEFTEVAAIAEKHDVSLSWLGRQALLELVERYRNEQLQLPLRLAVGNTHHPRPKSTMRRKDLA